MQVNQLDSRRGQKKTRQTCMLSVFILSNRYAYYCVKESGASSSPCFNSGLHPHLHQDDDLDLHHHPLGFGRQ